MLWFGTDLYVLRLWEWFVQMLRKEYLPFDYEADLRDEIRARAQGSSERLGDYFPCMINLFKRLPTSPSEEQKL